MAEIFEAAFEYNIYQQIYCLSVLANCCGKSRGTAPKLEKELKGYVDKLIGLIPGSWNVSYGPCVYKGSDGNTGPENAWFAATSTVGGKPYCVVAVAGTAASSPDAIRGDMAVDRMVDFEAWQKGWSGKRIPSPSPAQVSGRDDSRCFISWGTADAVRNVLGERGHAEPPRQMSTIEYVTSLPDNYTVVFTGHSLGAAITPTAALGLADKDHNLMGGKTVYVVPSAGASPGVRAFTERYKNRFGPAQDQGGYKVYNLVYYNQWDVVPQAWAADKDVYSERNFDNILGETYNTATQAAKDIVGSQVQKAKANLEKEPPSPKYRPHYIPLPGRSFQAKKPDRNTAFNVLTEVRNQHADYYWIPIGIQEFVKKVKQNTPMRMEPAVFDTEAMAAAAADKSAEDGDHEQVDGEEPTA